MLIINLVKKLFVYISGLLTYLSLPLIAFAVTATTTTSVSLDPCQTDANNVAQAGGITGVLCKLGGGNLANTIRNIVIFFIVIAFVIALFYLLFGGIKWITSGGDKTQVEAARNHIMAAIIGLVIVFLAIFILYIILAAFGINPIQLQIPVIGATPTP